MNTLAMLPMLIAMICAASCALFDKCRTTASLICAAVMVLSMVDVMLTHFLPVSLLAALIAATGLWAGIAGWKGEFRDLLLRTYRVISSVAMAGLLFRHTAAMAMDPAMGDMAHEHLHALGMPSLAGAGSVALLVAGVALTITLLRSRQGNPRGIAGQVAALEPALMGLSLVLMTI